MIGSSTYIVKTDNKFYVHIVGGGGFIYQLEQAAAKRKQSVYQFLSKSLDKYRKTPNATVDEAVAIKIADATQCRDEGSPGYSEFAGDCIFLVDEDKKRCYYRSRARDGIESHWKMIGAKT